MDYTAPKPTDKYRRLIVFAKWTATDGWEIQAICSTWADAVGAWKTAMMKGPIIEPIIVEEVPIDIHLGG